MLTKHALIALGLGIAMSAFSIPALGQNDSSVVAEIGGRKVTADELAEKEALSRDELYKRHVAINVPEPTEDQLRFYYEGVQTDETYESARIHIIDTVHQLRTKKARDAYLAELRAQYGVVVELSQPSAHVEVANAERLGSENAPVQIIEFADYECPYCQKVNEDLRRLR